MLHAFPIPHDFKPFTGYMKPASFLFCFHWFALIAFGLVSVKDMILDTVLQLQYTHRVDCSCYEQVNLLYKSAENNIFHSCPFGQTKLFFSSSSWLIRVVSTQKISQKTP